MPVVVRRCKAALTLAYCDSTPAAQKRRRHCHTTLGIEDRTIFPQRAHVWDAYE